MAGFMIYFHRPCYSDSDHSKFYDQFKLEIGHKKNQIDRKIVEKDRFFD